MSLICVLIFLIFLIFLIYSSLGVDVMDMRPRRVLYVICLLFLFIGSV